MTTADQILRFESLLAPFALEFLHLEEGRSDAVVPPARFHQAVEALVSGRWGYLAAITGLDAPAGAEAPGQVIGLYQFCEGAAVGTIRVSLPYDQAQLPSICDLIPSATLYEREFIEMFGVTITDTPDPSRLLISDDWPDGVYPLRKSFTSLEEIGAAKPGEAHES